MLPARKNPKRRTTGLRGPEYARQRLLQAAFREVYLSGFQSPSLKAILATNGVIAGFLIAMLEGYVSLAKNAQDAKVLKVGLKNIEERLRSLRAGPTAQRDRPLRHRDGSCL